MYQPGIIGRTREERLDVFKAWSRPDKAFFSSGACHILGHLFFWMHRDEGFRLVYIKPDKGFPGSHMFASDGTWAFDFNGWALEKELLDAHAKAYADFHKGWGYTKIVLENGLFDSMEAHLPPQFFPYSPWERAYKYIQQFPSHPLREKVTPWGHFREAFSSMRRNQTLRRLSLAQIITDGCSTFGLWPAFYHTLMPLGFVGMMYSANYLESAMGFRASHWFMQRFRPMQIVFGGEVFARALFLPALIFVTPFTPLVMALAGAPYGQ